MWPMYWLLLIPMVIVEYYVARSYLSIGLTKIFWPIATANIFSVLIGIPIVWGFLALIEFVLFPQFLEPVANILSPLQLMLNVTLGAAWIAPYAKHLFWSVPVAAMFLLIPFYFVSVWIESFILVRVFKISNEAAPVKKACWRANLVSYLLLFLICLGMLIWSFYEYYYK